MYICVDFDGTIVAHEFPDIGEPVPGAIEAMKKWNELGAKLILFTMRSGPYLEKAINYLSNQGVEFYGINHNPDQSSWSQSPKAYGHIYVDDAAFGCPLTEEYGFERPCVDWQKVEPTISTHLRAIIGRSVEGGK